MDSFRPNIPKGGFEKSGINLLLDVDFEQSVVPKTTILESNQLKEPVEELPAERTTILRVKRDRNDYGVDVLVVEAEPPAKKKHVEQVLTKALDKLELAKKLHNDFLVEKRLIEKGENKSLPQRSFWSAPNKKQETKLKKVFRWIGSSEEKKDIGLLIERFKSHSKGTSIVERGRNERLRHREAQAKSNRTFLLKRLEELRSKKKGQDDIKVLELICDDVDGALGAKNEVSNKEYLKKKASSSQILTLPVVESSKKINLEKQLKVQSHQEDINGSLDVYITDYYILEGKTDNFQEVDFETVRVPLEDFRTELLEEYSLINEYSDSEKEFDSDDSQNRDWDYADSDVYDDDDDDDGTGNEEEEDEGDVDVYKDQES